MSSREGLHKKTEVKKPPTRVSPTIYTPFLSFEVERESFIWVYIYIHRYAKWRNNNTCIYRPDDRIYMRARILTDASITHFNFPKTVNAKVTHLGVTVLLYVPIEISCRLLWTVMTVHDRTRELQKRVYGRVKAPSIIARTPIRYKYTTISVKTKTIINVFVEPNPQSLPTRRVFQIRLITTL